MQTKLISVGDEMFRFLLEKDKIYFQIKYRYTDCIFKWTELLTGIVPVNNSLLTGTGIGSHLPTNPRVVQTPQQRNFVKSFII